MTRQPFSLSDDFVARKNFQCQGKRYAIGDRFPWRRHAIATRRLRQLFESGWIGYAEGKGPVVDEPAPAVVLPVPEPDPPSEEPKKSKRKRGRAVEEEPPSEEPSANSE